MHPTLLTWERISVEIFSILLFILLTQVLCIDSTDNSHLDHGHGNFSETVGNYSKQQIISTENTLSLSHCHRSLPGDGTWMGNPPYWQPKQPHCEMQAFGVDATRKCLRLKSRTVGHIMSLAIVYPVKWPLEWFLCLEVNM
jgi:hypothetical protein